MGINMEFWKFQSERYCMGPSEWNNRVRSINFYTHSFPLEIPIWFNYLIIHRGTSHRSKKLPKGMKGMGPTGFYGTFKWSHNFPIEITQITCWLPLKMYGIRWDPTAMEACSTEMSSALAPNLWHRHSPQRTSLQHALYKIKLHVIVGHSV